MFRVSRRIQIGSPVLWCAALLGALAGAMFSRSHAGACDCGGDAWRLTLGQDSADDDAWPAVARLEARPGTVVLWSEDLATQTIDYIHAGEP
jgi:hypothetical protein